MTSHDSESNTLLVCTLSNHPNIALSLKAFLDARSVPVPQNGKRDELVATVRANAHKAAGGFNQYNFDTWDKEHLV